LLHNAEFLRQQSGLFPRKLLAVRRVEALGWQAGIGLEEGLRDACQWFGANCACARG
jgi:GDP-L-fucose synthase